MKAWQVKYRCHDGPTCPYGEFDYDIAYGDTLEEATKDANDYYNDVVSLTRKPSEDTEDE